MRDRVTLHRVKAVASQGLRLLRLAFIGTSRVGAAAIVLGLAGGLQPVQAQSSDAGSVAAGSRVAMTVTQAYQAALGNDPLYLQGMKELEAARQGVPLARASLLPQVAFNASVSRVLGTREFGNSLNQSVRVPLDYEAPQYSLSLRTPLFNYEAMSRLRQASSLVEGAEALMASRHMDLVNRLNAAYLQVLIQQEAVAVAVEELNALKTQAEQARRRFARGEGTRQDVATTEAAAGLSQTRLIQARDELTLAQRGLQRITGIETPTLTEVSAGFAGLGLPLPALQDWFSQALANSPILRFRNLNLAAARHGVERQRAGHFPRVDLVASVTRSQNDSVSTLNQTSQQRSIGVQLAMPIFSGWAVEAGVAQSLAERDRVEQELRAERESLLLEVERLYQLTSQGKQRLAAYVQALEAADLAVKAASRAQDTGLGTAAEVRDWIARQAGARRDLIQARYEYLNHRSQLLVVAGWPLSQVLNGLESALSVANPLKDRQP